MDVFNHVGARTHKLLHFVLVGQGLYLGEEGCVVGQRGPAEEQSEGFGARERWGFEREPASLLVCTESCESMCQRRAQSLQKQLELSGLHPQPDRREGGNQTNRSIPFIMSTATVNKRRDVTKKYDKQPLEKEKESGKGSI